MYYTATCFGQSRDHPQVDVREFVGFPDLTQHMSVQINMKLLYNNYLSVVVFITRRSE
jgi:hypothetical protein